MSEQKLISDEVRGWRILGGCFVAFVACTSGCVATNNWNDNRAVVALVEKGADPMAAKCAIRPNDSAPACALVAAKK